MTDKDQELMKFPCEFPIKIMGYTGDDFEKAAFSIVNRHFPDLTEGAFKLTPSKENKYTSISVTVTATSKKQLDDLYQELSDSDQILMTL